MTAGLIIVCCIAYVAICMHLGACIDRMSGDPRIGRLAKTRSRSAWPKERQAKRDLRAKLPGDQVWTPGRLR